MKTVKFIQILLMAALFSACTQPEYLSQNSAFIVFKTPTFKYADMGFIYENRDEIKVEIYGSGQALFSLRISENSVCMSLLACMSKESFNKKVLNRSYPNGILNNIFRGKQIFNGSGFLKKSNGFTQRITKQDKYNIYYTVLNKQIIFHDTINNILIKVKRVQ